MFDKTGGRLTDISFLILSMQKFLCNTYIPKVQRKGYEQASKAIHQVETTRKAKHIREWQFKNYMGEKI